MEEGRRWEGCLREKGKRTRVGVGRWLAELAPDRHIALQTTWLGQAFKFDFRFSSSAGKT